MKNKNNYSYSLLALPLLGLLLATVGIAKLAGSSQLENEIRSQSVKIMCAGTFVERFLPMFPPVEMKGLSQGTGVFVGPGLILTEAHVVKMKKGVILVLKSGKTRMIPAKLLKIDVDRDLAILEISDKDNKVARITHRFKLGQRVIAIGNSGQEDFELAPAKITSISLVMRETGRIRQAIQMENEHIRPGFSGGGVFNDNGEVVGMTEASGFEGAGLAIQGRELKEYLKNNLPGGK